MPSCISIVSTGSKEVCGWVEISSPFVFQFKIYTIFKTDLQDVMQALYSYRHIFMEIDIKIALTFSMYLLCDKLSLKKSYLL